MIKVYYNDLSRDEKTQFSKLFQDITRKKGNMEIKKKIMKNLKFMLMISMIHLKKCEDYNCQQQFRLYCLGNFDIIKKPQTITKQARTINKTNKGASFKKKKCH